MCIAYCMSKMKQKFALVFSIIVWLAVIIQFFVMLENRVVSIAESSIRFFSFFTILTNILVAVYFTFQSNKLKPNSFWNRPGTLTAITVYILVVGLVYQIVLRPIWDPQGLARLTDELLHSVNPLLVLYFWWRYEKFRELKWSQLPKWLIYPFLYFIWAMTHGLITGFYPYPFVNLPEIGLAQLSINFIVLVSVFLGFSVLLMWLGEKVNTQRDEH